MIMIIGEGNANRCSYADIHAKYLLSSPLMFSRIFSEKSSQPLGVHIDAVTTRLFHTMVEITLP